MSEHYTLHLGDNLEALRAMADNSVDSIVTDPPYGLSFMGKKWDYDVPSVETWRECLRVLKPGGHLLAFAGTRTQHRMAVNIEDAGFEIRDMIAWVYGSGFPKSHDVSKAIDRDAGAEREVVGTKLGLPGYSLTDGKGGLYGKGFGANGIGHRECRITAPATDAAKQWAGWGTALKPAMEPITVARKPLQGTVASNVLEYGTGGLNIDGCRIDGEKGVPSSISRSGSLGWNTGGDMERKQQQNGRWPANLIHDGSEEVTELFPTTTSGDWKGQKTGGKGTPQNGGEGYFSGKKDREYFWRGNTGSAARFFYCAKASNADRNEGLEGRNHHPTVKPTDLMRYLCRLVTPPGGLILDPYMGSGSTGKAAMLEGFRFVGCEMEPEYMEIARARIAHAASQVVQQELL